MVTWTVIGRSGPVGRGLNREQAEALALASGCTIQVEAVGVKEEPYAHRGHPDEREERKARLVGEQLGVLIAVLTNNGFDHDEAVAFVAGTAWEIGYSQGETWSDPHNAVRTIDGLLRGYKARAWSLCLIEQAITKIKSIMEDG